MAIEILDAVSDAHAWAGWLKKLPARRRDVYFQAEYSALHLSSVEGMRALLFVYERAGHLWLYAFLLRPIEQVGRLALAETWFDIETPYGYGGPLASTEDEGFLSGAHAAFTAWCLEQRVVAEFVRLHPLMRNERWLDPRMEVVYDRKTVSLDLKGFENLSIDELPFDKTTRYMLRRASGLSVGIEACPSNESFEQFVQLYRRTLERLSANEHYYFSEDYFARLRRLICDSGWLLAAKDNAGSVVAAALFLKGPTWLHYHLSASEPERRVPGATNQLIYTAARLGSMEKLQALHLGGGVSQASDDSLFKFKRKSGTDEQVFHVGKRIHEPQIYAALRKAWEQAYPSLREREGERLLCYRSRI